LAEYKSNDPELNILQVRFFPIGEINQIIDFLKSITYLNINQDNNTLK
jgi:hypothetical protein